MKGLRPQAEDSSQLHSTSSRPTYSAMTKQPLSVKMRLARTFASLDSDANAPIHGRRKRQTNCNRCEKRSKDFRPKRVQSNRYWSESVGLPPRPVTVKSVIFS